MSLLSFSKYYSHKTVPKEIHRKIIDTYIDLGSDILNEFYIDQKLDMWCPDNYFKLNFDLSNLFIYLRRIRERSKRPEITGINDKQKKVQRYE